MVSFSGPCWSILLKAKHSLDQFFMGCRMLSMYIPLMVTCVVNGESWKAMDEKIYVTASAYMLFHN